jgi:hypothetical protein
VKLKGPREVFGLKIKQCRLAKKMPIIIIIAIINTFLVLFLSDMRSLI